MTEKVRVLSVDIMTGDNLYYVSRESGNRFSTKPYVMHTALYYALGIFPSRFRCADQTPFYDEDCSHAEGVYIHPAVLTEPCRYETRRFAVKDDRYRTESKRLNRNLMETGHQKSIVPGSAFRTYVVSQGCKKVDELVKNSPLYIRIGKKMTSTKVDVTDFGTHDVDTGAFKLSQPVSNKDLDLTTEYNLLGELRWERMNPVDLLLEGMLDGPHVSFSTNLNHGEEQVQLPSNATFLGY